jgi:type III secretory pathway component EscS
MHIASSIVSVASESVDHTQLALQTLPYGLLAVAVFGILALITASYSNVAHRHAPAKKHDDEHQQH